MAADVDGGGLVVLGQTSERVSDFDALLRPHLRSAFRLAHAMLGDRVEAEDAVQDAALSAWRAFDRFQDRGSGVGPWFLTIVANQCRGRRRSHWWRVWRSAEIDTGSTPSHEDGVVARSRLGTAFECLSPEQRTLLLLRYRMDLSHEQIAGILSLRSGTVKSRIHRAIARLRSAMGEEMDDDGI